MGSNKEIWTMTREKWIKEKKFYGIDWHNRREPIESSFIPDWELSEAAELQAINEYFGTHDDIYNIIHNRLGEIDPLEYDDDREWEFVNSEWMMQVKSNIKDAYRDDAIWVEDAREAIILGRRLGYYEIDILTYIIRTYVPDLYEIILKGKKIPPKYLDIFPNLRSNLKY